MSLTTKTGSGPVSSEVGQMAARIPMVVLGGWLGAGKTTMINRLLRVAGDERIAVVVNDIGEVNLDAELIAARDGDTVELTNGCVCCSIGDSLAMTLRDLVLRDQITDDSAAKRRLDRLVVEASGVAEPDRVAAYGDRRRIRPDGIVVAVDATDVVARAADPVYGPLVVRQVRAADLIMVTKVDLAPDGGAGARAWCAEVAPGVLLVDAAPAGPDGWIRSLLGSPPTRLPIDAAEAAAVPAPAMDLRVETAVWHAHGPVDVDRLVTALERLRGRLGPSLLRAKAVVAALDGTPTAVHLSAGMVSVEPAPMETAGQSGSLVCIAAPGAMNGVDLGSTFQAALGPAFESQDPLSC